MAGKITDYPTTTVLIDEDLFDLSKYDGVSAYATNAIKWEDILKEIQIDLTFNNIYNNNGTLAGNRTVSMGVNDLTFGSTGEANLLRFDSTSDRIGIGTAAPTAKLEVVGTSYFNGNVGIGTSTPTEKLEVVGNAKINGAIEIKGTTNYTALSFDNTTANKNNNILFKDAGTTVGQFHYDLFGGGAFGDGFKLYAKTPLSTDAETMVWDSNDNVHVPNGNFFVGLSAPASVEASAIIQANSVSKGFLPPRMNTTQKNAITSPATGLIVFDTVLAKLAVYTGAGWETVTSV
jgi:hypothetical protein